MDKESSRCFAWFISFKKSFNERWTKFRNRFRRRFYARREQTLDPSTLLNETGTNDILVTKKLYKSNQVCPMPYSIKMKEIPGTEATDYEEIFDKLVEEYVSRVIAAAAEVACFGKQQSFRNTAIISEPSAADDNASLSSSIISQMADAVVTESLKNIVQDCNRNQSAESVTRRKTVAEIVEMFCVVKQEAGDNPSVGK